VRRYREVRGAQVAAVFRLERGREATVGRRVVREDAAFITTSGMRACAATAPTA
jgi:hypothetical protein